MSPSRQAGIPRILIVAGLFILLGLALQAWRSWVLLASYGKGIFQQVLGASFPVRENGQVIFLWARVTYPSSPVTRTPPAGRDF